MGTGCSQAHVFGYLTSRTSSSPGTRTVHDASILFWSRPTRRARRRACPSRSRPPESEREQLPASLRVRAGDLGGGVGGNGGSVVGYSLSGTTANVWYIVKSFVGSARDTTVSSQMSSSSSGQPERKTAPPTGTRTGRRMRVVLRPLAHRRQGQRDQEPAERDLGLRRSHLRGPNSRAELIPRPRRRSDSRVLGLMRANAAIFSVEREAPRCVTKTFADVSHAFSCVVKRRHARPPASNRLKDELIRGARAVYTPNKPPPYAQL